MTNMVWGLLLIANNEFIRILMAVKQWQRLWMLMNIHSLYTF